jgi:hypothetical protein
LFLHKQRTRNTAWELLINVHFEPVEINQYRLLSVKDKLLLGLKEPMFKAKFFYASKGGPSVVCFADDNGVMWRVDFMHYDKRSVPMDSLFDTTSFVDEKGRVIVDPSLQKVIELEVQQLSETNGSSSR